MNEQPEILRLNIGGEELEFGRENVSLFTFLGHLAAYDHVFLVKENEEGEDECLYIFQTHEGYTEVKDFVVRNNYPQHMHLTEVSPTDTRVFDMYHYYDIKSEASFPEEWIES